MSQGIVERGQTPRTVLRYQPLVIVLTALAAGIVGDRTLPAPAGLWWTVAAGAWLAWLWSWRRGIDRAAAALLLIAVAACGGSWHHLRWHLFADDDLGHFARLTEQPICIEAVARSGPRRQVRPRDNPMRVLPVSQRTRVEVDVVGLRNGPEWQRASGRARLVVAGHLLGVHAGDRLRIFAQLGLPRPPQNPGEFDFARHARGDRRRSVLIAEFPECVEVVRRAGLWSLSHGIENLRTGGHRLLWSYLKNGLFSRICGWKTGRVLGLCPRPRDFGGMAPVSNGPWSPEIAAFSLE